MSITPLPESLAFELSPPLLIGGRRAVGAYLNQWITQPGEVRRSSGSDSALVLCALLFQVADRVLADLALSPRLMTKRRWSRKLLPQAQHVAVQRLAWAGSSPIGALPLQRTSAFMRSIPDELLQRALSWAPPVVTRPDRHSQHWVCANHLSALLGRQLAPAQAIEVRVLQRGCSLRRTLPEICQGVCEVFGAVYELHRGQICTLARDWVEASLLTGYSKAQYFRFKRGRGE